MRFNGGGGTRRMLQEFRNGIGDADGGGRHRPYLIGWRDPNGEIRFDLAYPTSAVAKLESDAAAAGQRIRQTFGIVGVAS
jgi:hypothetical protein